MKKAKFVYVIYIQSTLEKVWEALTDPKFTSKYWEHENISDWKPGSKWDHRRNNSSEIDVTGTVVESSPPHLLIMTWADPDEASNPAKISRVRFDLSQQKPGVVRLMVTHDELEAGGQMEQGITRGWPLVLSNLKSFLETGKAVEMW
jgi:uncharacterized protein YndB with AHSA1/START domain